MRIEFDDICSFLCLTFFFRCFCLIPIAVCIRRTSIDIWPTTPTLTLFFQDATRFSSVYRRLVDISKPDELKRTILSTGQAVPIPPEARSCSVIAFSCLF